MENTTSSADGSQALTSGSPQAGAPTTDGQAPVSQTPHTAKPSEHERIIEELRKENASHRKKLSAYEESEKQQAEAKRLADEAQLSEIERVKKQHADIQAQYNAQVLENQEIKIRYAVERDARELHFVYPEDVIGNPLFKRSEIEFDDNGVPTNVKQLLEKIAKARPKLVEQPAPAPDTSQQGTPQTAPMRPGTPALPVFNPGRTQIAQPGTIPPGQRITLADIRNRRK